MLSLQQAYEVRASIIEYLKATFTFKEKAVGEAFLKFVEDKQEGLFKGPYISLKLPFEKGAPGSAIPLDIQPPFPPFAHQLRAFQRLSTQSGHEPEPTILTTGTGSGKTESFLYPILDYCYRQEGRPGIKCIILYPMNALATDQAGRLARAIYDDPRLKGRLTAGLFIGLGRDSRKYPKDMVRGHIIENREAIIDSPPDILLTNFKMLDYALMRSNFHKLWLHNLKDPGLLRFLVLDELHTYDGAQGTDVANLIRRLKLRLNIPPGQLCPVGTSATMGAGAEAPRLLAEYATQVFGEHFTEGSIIAEERETTEYFFVKPKSELFNRLPSRYMLQFSMLQAGEDFQSYLKRQLSLWQIDPQADKASLGRELKDIRLVWDIVDLCSRQLLTISELIRKLDYLNEEFRKIPEWDEEHQFHPKESVVRSLLSLIAEAKTVTPLPNGQVEMPFLYLQAQLWARELSGIVRVLSPEPVFTWRDKRAPALEPKALPAYYCRECGASGWLGVKHDNRNKIEEDILEVYNKYFSNHKNVFFINTDTPEHKHVEEYTPTEALHTFANQYSLHLHDKEGPGRLPIIAYRSVRNNRSQHFCPECNTRNSMNIIGMRVSSMASVTASQVLASDLDEQTEKERKILAFTNGVQDAAHQAGYMEARNYRFTFRTALQQTIRQFSEPVSLSRLQGAFIDYWKEHADESGQNNLEAYLYKFFPSDRAGEVKASAYKQKDGSYSDFFVREFDERIRWEIASEFGFNAVIGRTLEKTGASAVNFDQAQLEKAFTMLEPWLAENLMGAFEKGPFLHFLNGFLHRIRIRGGVNHEYLSKFRTRNLKLWDLNWMNDKRHFLNRRFGPKSRFPRLATTQAEHRGLLDSTFSNQDNWFHAYLKKSFPLAPYRDAINEFFAQLVKVLAQPEVGLLDEKTAAGLPNYCLREDAILVSHETARFECGHCGHQLVVAAQGKEGISDASCLQFNCLGKYQEAPEKSAENYYQQVYNRRRAPRVYATDHTGLLERSDREQKERDFKERPHFHSLNALVATSTLEMGIDIGDLNVTMNTNVPPLPANFLQRVGRAGRKTGSALIINFASNKPHDLFYFEAPTEMMEGEVSTPGCYLDARDILKRHFFAFCIDSWTADKPEQNSIPLIVRNIKPASANLDDSQFFLNRLIHFIKLNEAALLERFTSMYDGLVEKDVLKSLRTDMANELFYNTPRKVFRQLQQEYHQLQDKRKQIKKQIEERGLGKEDPERAELEKEIRNINGALKAIEKRQVLEHMTNTGLLPNYAFPETGVTLFARVMGRPPLNSEAPPNRKDIELVRPASQAIKELIPDNLFYTQGYKLKVSGLNIINWKEEVEEYRYCGNCDHIQAEAKAEKGPCPKCGDESWASSANRHQFVRLQAVKSFNDEADARLDDSSEERQSEFANRSLHFHFQPEAALGAYAIRKVPFGIEFVRQADIMEVNAGLESDFMDRSRITHINGKEAAVAGYITCRHCGRSSTQTHKRVEGKSGLAPKEARDYHFAYCRERNRAYQGKADEVFEELFLYRKMTTEVLKVLLPVQEFESESAVSMFRAGIELGLRRYYRGNPQHINVSHYAEFNSQTLKKDRYLILYDIIPGGTGYLEKLFQPEEFGKVLKLAHKAIRECQCQHHGKDGCYHCIFTYTNQFEQEELSRQKAEKLFGRIVDALENWEFLPHGLGKVSNTGQIEESELEDRFVRAFRNFAGQEKQQEQGWAFEEINLEGIIAYRLKVVHNGNVFRYMVQPQYRLGPARGVRFSTIADFLIRCEGAIVDGREWPLDELLAIRPIAIYLDGYQYHASNEHPRFKLDIEKRSAILESGEYLCWTLTWDDIGQFEEQLSDGLGKSVNQHTDTRQVLRRHPLFKKLDGEVLRAVNNFSRLLWLLKNGYRADNLLENFHAYLFCLQEAVGKVSLSEAHVDDFLRTGMPLDGYPHFADQQGNSFLFLPIPTESEHFHFRLFLRMRNLELQGGVLIRHRGDGFPKADWDTFWKVFNLIQLAGVRYKVEESEQDMEPALLEAPAAEEDVQSPEEIIRYYDEEYHPLVQQLLEAGIDFSRDGSFVLTDEKEEVLAEAILGFETARIVLGPLSEEDAAAFRERGYKIMEPENFDVNLIRNP